jgi:hypothetical protein
MSKTPDTEQVLRDLETLTAAARTPWTPEQDPFECDELLRPSPQPRREHMTNNSVTVPAGTLVTFEGVGVQVRAEFNDPEYGEQPYVSIDTSDLPARFTYDEKTGLRGDTDFPPFSFDEDGACGLVKRGEEVVSRHYPYERSSWYTHRAAKAEAKRLNDEWRRESCGMPIIAVHLNDGTEIYDDEGEGNKAHLTEQVKERLLHMALDAERARDEDAERSSASCVWSRASAATSGALTGRAMALREVLEMLDPGAVTT